MMQEENEKLKQAMQAGGVSMQQTSGMSPAGQWTLFVSKLHGICRILPQNSFTSTTINYAKAAQDYSWLSLCDFGG